MLIFFKLPFETHEHEDLVFLYKADDAALQTSQQASGDELQPCARFPHYLIT